jgi:hypothetical protein
VILAVIGLDPAAGDLLQAQELYHGVSGGHAAVPNFGDEIFLEVAVNSQSFRRELALTRTIRRLLPS